MRWCRHNLLFIYCLAYKARSKCNNWLIRNEASSVEIALQERKECSKWPYRIISGGVGGEERNVKHRQQLRMGDRERTIRLCDGKQAKEAESPGTVQALLLGRCPGPCCMSLQGTCKPELTTWMGAKSMHIYMLASTASLINKIQ